MNVGIKQLRSMQRPQRLHAKVTLATNLGLE